MRRGDAADDPTPTPTPAPLPVWAAVGVFTLLAAAVRLASLRALPVFGDEAINLRLAVLARRDLPARLWISLQEAQAPLHVWLLALVLPVARDPVYVGRLLSVAAAVVTVPAAAWTALRTLEAFRTRRPDPFGGEARMTTITAGATAVLFALCPFFVFAQRLARVDAPFLLEATLAAGLSIELASRAVSGRGRLIAPGALLGLLMGATMLTRQAVSYPLWLLAPIAWVLLPRPSEPQPRSPSAARRLLAALAIAAVVAGALWLPMLLAPGSPDTMTRIFHSSDYRPAMTVVERLRLTRDNVRLAAEAGWAYLTPPVLVLAALGFLDLLASGRRLLLFLLLWEAILLAPAAVFAASYFPRYALPAALPVCIAAALGVAWLWARIRLRVPWPAARAALALGLGLAAIGPSLAELLRGERDWRDWRLLPIDREQFVSGPSGGLATEAAADFLRRAAGAGPLVVLTPEFAGNPTDGVWLLLEGDPRVRLSYAPDALQQPLLPPAGADRAPMLPGDLRDPLRHAATAALPAGAPVFAIVMDPLLTRAGRVGAVPYFARLNPGLSEATRFENPADPGNQANSVVVLRLRGPPS